MQRACIRAPNPRRLAFLLLSILEEGIPAQLDLDPTGRMLESTQVLICPVACVNSLNLVPPDR